LQASLERDFAYEKCEIIRLSEVIQEHTEKATVPQEFERLKKLIELGNDLRKSHGGSILAELAIGKIVLERQKAKTQQGDDAYKPRRVCHIIDSIKNQQELEILRLVYRDMLYFVGVFAPLPVRERALEKRGITRGEIYQLIDKDSGEEINHGQTVRDTFPEADFFLRIDSDTDTQLKARVDRFLNLILGTRPITPSSGETAMYLAASASGNSACLSRQVGAALTDKNGTVLAVGWNDVPKAGGNLYVSNPQEDPNADRDKRCWNIDGGTCFNDQEKRLISQLLVDSLVSAKLISEEDRSRAVSEVASNTKVKDLIEFSRSVHAA
jgi:deoxycytidylate deaminase